MQEPIAFIFCYIPSHILGTIFSNLFIFAPTWFSETKGTTSLSIVNRIFTKLDLVVDETYKAISQKDYGSGIELLDENQKWDPLRAMKTFIRRKVGHTT